MYHLLKEALTRTRMCSTDACFFEAWANGLVRRLRRSDLAVPGWRRRPRPMLAFGSTGGVLDAVDGSIGGGLDAVDGSMDGVLDGVRDGVDGSTGGE
jgi:hypothetical protein